MSYSTGQSDRSGPTTTMNLNYNPNVKRPPSTPYILTPPIISPTSSPSHQFLNGERETGQDVRSGNVTAALAIANICKTSLGPVGLDKMLVDDIGDVTITNDGATILKQLEVEHPAAKVRWDFKGGG